MKRLSKKSVTPPAVALCDGGKGWHALTDAAYYPLEAAETCRLDGRGKGSVILGQDDSLHFHPWLVMEIRYVIVFYFR